MAKIAVIKTGGKQYVVKAGDKIKIEKLSEKQGKVFNFKEILLVADESCKEVKVGSPLVKDSKVSAKVLKQAKDKKIRVVKYKNKTRYYKTQGHRQPYTQVQIESIN